MRLNMDFQQSLNEWFRFRGIPKRDNLPALAKPRYRMGPEGDFGRGCLARMMHQLQFRRGVEIGTHRGHSAVMWCKSNPQLHLTCIDPYAPYAARKSQRSQDAYYAEAIENLKGCDAEIIRGKSVDVVSGFANGSVDFVFIDGDHTFDAVAQDLILWAPKVRKGGLVALHDYLVCWRGGVVKAVDAYTHCHRIEPWYVTMDTSPTAFWQRGVERA